jgi:O-methyltransferase/methyltransferase family protein
MTQTGSEAPASPERILQTGLGFWGSRALLSAVELDLFTRLAQQPSNAEELRVRLGLHPRGALDFFDALVALGFLRRDGGVYSNSPDADLFLDKRKPSYVGGILEMASQRLFGFWNHLTEGLRTGELQNEGKGGGPSPFAAMYADAGRLRSFLAAMSGVSHGANMTIARKFPWKEYSTFVDAGTAQGDLAVQVALANPHLKGTGLDLPVVQPIFEEYTAKNGVADRVSFGAVDFFNAPLPKADVVMMGHILHDWDLGQKKMLVGKAYDALPAGGAFIVYDAIIDDDRRQNAFGLLMSLNMLIETPAGFDYTGADCIGWMKEAGFKETRVEHLVGPDSMVIGIK